MRGRILCRVGERLSRSTTTYLGCSYRILRVSVRASGVSRSCPAPALPWPAAPLPPAPSAPPLPRLPRSVLTFEATEPGFPEEEAVRVYVRFASQAVARAALQSLDGRFFGGRTVRATYFDEGRFEAGDLAPRPHEVPGLLE